MGCDTAPVCVCVTLDGYRLPVISKPLARAQPVLYNSVVNVGERVYEQSESESVKFPLWRFAGGPGV